LFSVRYAEERGIELRWVKEPGDPEEWKAKIDENTRFVYGELPTNPQQSFFDIKKIAEIAHSNGIPLIVDSTLATPALMRPIEFGADIVVHSLTKSMTASGLALGGAIISKSPITTNVKNENPLFRDSFADYVKLLPYRDNGPAASPFNALMAQNDLRTLRSRMAMLSTSSQRIAEFLENHPKVAKVDYLGLESSEYHDIASKYMHLVDDGTNMYGHLMSIRIDGTAEETRKVFDALKLIYRATDLGRIKSIATIPAISTHQQQGEEGRNLADIPPQMIRLCVGAETTGDLIEDLDQALSVIH
jgi:O-acetylhomoserine/O-acetylserine sulfhydrylase-like pyridoxal-dependent enzyme